MKTWQFLTIISYTLLLFANKTIAQKQQASEVFSYYELIQLNPQSIFAKANSKNRGAKFFKIANWDVKLYPSDLISPFYKSFNQTNRKNQRSNAMPIPMQGYNSKGGKVSLTFTEGEVSGYIKEEEEIFYIESAGRYQLSQGANKNTHIIYNSKDVVSTEPSSCLLNDEENFHQRIRQSIRASSLCYEVEIAVCNDKSMVQAYGGIQQTEDHIIALLNNVASNYNDEFGDEIRFILTGQYSVAINGFDPWTNSTDSRALLADFAAWSNNNLPFSYDIASLWTNRDLDGTVVGVAWIYGLCNDGKKYNVNQNYNLTGDLLRVLWAHEIGHNLGAGHDGLGSPYIMAPGLSNTNIWSDQSVESILNYLPVQNCAAICPGTTPRLDFVTNLLHMDELQITGGIDSCQVPYLDLEIEAWLSHYGEYPVTAFVSIDSNSTASEGKDFALIQPHLLFDTIGDLTQTITLRLYNDLFEEEREYLELNMNVESGEATIGSKNPYRLELTSNEDQFASTCCTTLDFYDIFADDNDTVYLKPLMFWGSREDARTRIVIPATLLFQQGMTASEIDQIGLFVRSKGSNGVYRDLRVGLKNIPENNLENSPWYATQEVYFGDYETREDVWNYITLDSTFYWDGVSNIYLEVCFNNAVKIGSDFIGTLVFDAGGNELCGTRIDKDKNGCSLNHFSTYIFYDDRVPEIRFRVRSDLVLANLPSANATNRLFLDETANFTDQNGNVMATITNTGSQDILCTQVELVSVGSGKLNLPASNHQYTQRSYYVDGDTKSSYRLTLYFDSLDLVTWGSEISDLNFIHSQIPIDLSTNEDRRIIGTLDWENLGLGIYQFTTEVVGSGYFALVNGYEEISKGGIEDGSLVNSSAGEGLVFYNSLGNSYLLSIDNDENIVLHEANNPDLAGDFSGGDFTIKEYGNGVVLTDTNGSFHRLFLDNEGEIIKTKLSNLPANILEITEGNFCVNNLEHGFILTSPNGLCWRLYVDDHGFLSTMQVKCENQE